MKTTHPVTPPGPATEPARLDGGRLDAARARSKRLGLHPGTYDPREVACPRCEAPAGSYCRRPSGHSGPLIGPHADRIAAAVGEWQREELAVYGGLVLWTPEAVREHMRSIGPADAHDVATVRVPSRATPRAVPTPPPTARVQLALF